MFIDILFFAVIAALLAYRLHTVLGRKDFEADDEVKERLKARTRARMQAAPKEAPTRSIKDVTPLGPVVAKPSFTEEEKQFQAEIETLRHRNPAFSLGEFIEGAKRAFEYVLDSFCRGDTDALKPLLSTEIFSSFAEDIAAREKKSRRQEITLVSFLSAKVRAMSVIKDKARVTVEFVTQQISLVKDKHGKILEGNPSQVDEITDIWTFEKDIASRDPNWVLVSTEAA